MDVWRKFEGSSWSGDGLRLYTALYLAIVKKTSAMLKKLEMKEGPLPNDMMPLHATSAKNTMPGARHHWRQPSTEAFCRLPPPACLLQKEGGPLRAYHYLPAACARWRNGRRGRRRTVCITASPLFWTMKMICCLLLYHYTPAMVATWTQHKGRPRNATPTTRCTTTAALKEK